MAEAQKLDLIIVTPQGQKHAGLVDEIVAPGFLGEFGVLPQHIEMFVMSRPGVFTARVGDRRERWSVGKGFIEVGPDRVQLVVQSAERAEEIDVERATRAKTRAEKALSELDGTIDDPAYQEQTLRLARADARLQAAQGK
ncbi:MAG: ATP synthase F1 subunit epsilon [Myxococcales bacterium]|nr:MAG: ATP synthase F1 subunit epsilon [Myxococcales bacterium]